MSDAHVDLSDVELRTRLSQRNVPGDIARWLVDNRDDEAAARQLANILEDPVR